MVKLLGSTLLCVGGTMLCLQRITAERRNLRMLRELAAAIESIEMMIRWQKFPLPRAIALQKERPFCGEKFECVCSALKSGDTLHGAWKKVFGQIGAPELAEILCSIEWRGDEERLTGGLHYAAQQLRELTRVKTAEKTQREKLWVAVSAAVVGVLVIILL